MLGRSSMNLLMRSSVWVCCSSRSVSERVLSLLSQSKKLFGDGLDPDMSRWPLLAVATTVAGFAGVVCAARGTSVSVVSVADANRPERKIPLNHKF